MVNKMSATIKLLLLDVDGTLTDGGIYIAESGEQSKRFDVKDGMGIKMATDAGVQVGIISHSSAFKMIEVRAKMLGIQNVYVGKRPKLEVLNEWLESLELKYEEIAFIGDDVNDVEIMKTVGVSACPADATQPVKEIANVLLTKNGGAGCVREFIDGWVLI